MTKKTTPDQLLDLARAAQKNSHSPYSHVQVAAALRMTDGSTFSGVNIENASFGATVCAERVAIWKAVSELGAQKVLEIAVVSPEGWPPCGMCRQVLSEFATPETLIHVGNEKDFLQTYKFMDLLPEAFGPAHLLKK